MTGDPGQRGLPGKQVRYQKQEYIHACAFYTIMLLMLYRVWMEKRENLE